MREHQRENLICSMMFQDTSMLDRFVAWWFLIVHLHSLSNKVRQVAQTPSSSGFQPFPFAVVISAFCSTPAFVLGFRMSPSFYILINCPWHWAVCSTSPPKMDALMCFFFFYVSCSKRRSPRDTPIPRKNRAPAMDLRWSTGALLLLRQEIKQGYHEKLREFHPDKRPNSQEGKGKKITAQLRHGFSPGDGGQVYGRFMAGLPRNQWWSGFLSTLFLRHIQMVSCWWLYNTRTLESNKVIIYI